MMQPQPRRPAQRQLLGKGALLLGASGLAFGLVPVFYVGLPPDRAGIGLQILARVALASVALMLWLSLGSRRGGPEGATARPAYGMLVLNGLMLAVKFTAYRVSIALGTSPAKAILLVYLYPLWTLVLGWLLLGESLSPRKVLFVGTGMAGLLVAMGVWQVSNLGGVQPGDPFALLNGLASSFVLLIGRRELRGGEVVPLQAMRGSLAFATLWVLGFGAVSWVLEPASRSLWYLAVEVRSVALLLALGLVGTALPYGFMYSGLKHLEASTSALILLLEPVSVFVLQAVLLGIPIYWWQVVGGVVLLASGYLAQATVEAAGASRGFVRG